MKTELVIAALAAVIATAAFADRTIETTAPDGVNKITTTVNDAGYVTGRQTTCVHVMEKYDDGNALADAFDESIRADERRKAEKAYRANLVQAVYGEGTNSSFITRRELTATQKRFIALGNNLVAMTRYVQQLEARVRALEESRPNVLTVKRPCACEPKCGCGQGHNCGCREVK